jgi:hypothetical protein
MSILNSILLTRRTRVIVMHLRAEPTETGVPLVGSLCFDFKRILDTGDSYGSQSTSTTAN